MLLSVISKIIKNYLSVVLLLVTAMVYSQPTQVGQDIYGENVQDIAGLRVETNNLGNIIAVSAPTSGPTGQKTGSVRIFQLISDSWTQLGSRIDGINPSDLAGQGMDLNAAGDIVAVGAPWFMSLGLRAGHVRVFQYDGTDWNQLGSDIVGEDAEKFGGAVALSSDGLRLVVGAIENNVNVPNSGAVYVYEFNGSDWVQVGQSLYDGLANGDYFGSRVEINADGSRIAASRNYSSGPQFEGGEVIIYEFDGSNWNELGQRLNGTSVIDNFGVSMDLNGAGDRIVVGSTNNFDSQGLGRTKIFRLNGSVWEQYGQDVDGEFENRSSGYSTSINASGTRIAISSIVGGVNGSQSGQVRLYNLLNGQWVEMDDFINGDDTGNQLGRKIDLNESGSRIIIGVPFNDENGGNSGAAKIYDLNSNLGVNDFESVNNPILYPNPVATELFVHNLKEITNYKIYSVTGILVSSGTIKPREIVNVENLTNGIYFVQLDLGSVFKFVKE